jgi:hypothetical protein
MAFASVVDATYHAAVAGEVTEVTSDSSFVDSVAANLIEPTRAV